MVTDEQLDQWCAAHNALYAERIKLKRIDYTLRVDLLQWEIDGVRQRHEIPRGLNLAEQLMCVAIHNAGMHDGIARGRFELQGELLDLIGAQRAE